MISSKILNSPSLLSRCHCKQLSPFSFSTRALHALPGRLVLAQRTDCRISLVNVLTEIKLPSYSKLAFFISANFSVCSCLLPFCNLSLALSNCDLLRCHRDLYSSVVPQSKAKQGAISPECASFSFSRNLKIVM